MKNTLRTLVLAVLTAAFVLVTTGLFSASRVAFAYKVLNFPFYHYQDANSKMNNFVVSGWTGDFTALKIDTRGAENDTDENTYIRLRYIPGMGKQAAYGKNVPDMAFQKGYAGLAIQSNPENRWGTLRGGYDLSKAKKLFFFARGKNGGEQIEVGMREKNRNVMNRSLGLIELKKEWKLYEIDLTNLGFNETAGGLYVIVHARDNVYSAEVDIDEIYYTREVQPNYTVESIFAKDKI
jgi:hypothetical protein